MTGPQMRFAGVVATPVTPFTADDRLDAATLEKLVDFLVESGVQAVGLPMHIGESLNLTLEERKTLAEVAIKTVAGRVPVLVNASMPGTAQVVELARHAERAGAAGVIVISPYHWEPGPEPLFEHFVRVGSAIDIALLAYNFPKKVHVSITTPLLERLIGRLDNFVGMKDATYDMQYFTEACRRTSAARPGFAIFAGIEYLLPSMILGGAGSFSACGAVAPGAVRRLYEACATGRWDEARALQYRVSQLWQVLQVGYPGSIKAAMELLGRPVGLPRMPIPALSEDGKKRLRSELEVLRVFEDEPIGWAARHAHAV